MRIISMVVQATATSVFFTQKKVTILFFFVPSFWKFHRIFVFESGVFRSLHCDVVREYSI